MFQLTESPKLKNVRNKPLSLTETKESCSDVAVETFFLRQIHLPRHKCRESGHITLIYGVIFITLNQAETQTNYCPMA